MEIELLRTIDSSSGGSFIWKADNANTTAFRLQDESSNDYLVLDTSNAQLKTRQPLVLEDAAIGSTMQAMSWTLIDNSAGALVFFASGPTEMLRLDTTNSAERIQSAFRVELPDMLVTGADGYINFNTTTGSGGHGIRLNSGNIELKNSGGDWAIPLQRDQHLRRWHLLREHGYCVYGLDGHHGGSWIRDCAEDLGCVHGLHHSGVRLRHR